MKRGMLIPTGCLHNCGGRCPLYARVEEGRVIGVEGDLSPEGDGGPPQLRACLRGRAYRGLLYHRDRLKKPLRRRGKRGSGDFVEISWQEAAAQVAAWTMEIKEQFGNEAIYLNYGTGNSGLLNGIHSVRRLLSLTGGHLDHYLNYSNAQAAVGLPYSSGTFFSGHGREDILNSKLILLWGWNPVETIFGTGTVHYLRKAREKGIPMVAIDPRLTPTAAVFASRHLPVRPGTDNALLDAMAYVIFSEKLEDRAFLDRCCLGHDEVHLPPQAPRGQSYRSWVLGHADGLARTPAWAEGITGVPAEDTVSLAREYASVKPAAIISGYGPQRHYHGENFARGIFQLAALTGNVGLAGGGVTVGGGYALMPRVAPLPSARPHLVNPAIPVFTWTDGVKRGADMTAKDGLIGRDSLKNGIKMIYNFQSNTLINQHAHINGTRVLLEDESLCRHIVAADIFMTPSTKYADIILPVSTGFEKNEILHPWAWGDHLIFNNAVVEPLAGSRTDFAWCSLIAAQWGLEEEFTEGLSEIQWLERLYGEAQKKHEGLPDFAHFRRSGLVRIERVRPHVPFREEREDPLGHPFPTPSGKIEFYSSRLQEMGSPEEIPPVARYLPFPGGPADPAARRYPLQCMSCHPKHRANSTFYTVEALGETERQLLYINPLDAEKREIKSGDRVRVYNDRGAAFCRAEVTPLIMPGVINLPQGQWYQPEPGSLEDAGGSPNVLTMPTPTPLARANPQHSTLAEVVKAGKAGPGYE